MQHEGWQKWEKRLQQKMHRNTKTSNAELSSNIKNEDWLDNLYCPRCQKKLKKKVDLLSCSLCKLDFPIPEGIANFFENDDELANFFDERTRKLGDLPLVYGNEANQLVNWANLFNHYLRRKAFKKIIRLQDCVILDIGCGNGYSTQFLLKSNSVYGIDISIEMLKLAAHKGFKTVRSSACHPFPFRNNFFDAVLCLGVIPYFHEDKVINIFKEIKRVLKPKGFLFLSSPHEIISHLIPLIRQKRKRQKILKTYSQKEIIPLLKDFKPMNMSYNLYFPLPILIQQRNPYESKFSSTWIAKFQKN